ncbi:MAG: hypothetical protein RMN51_01255 [Verrucomicrobiota bacterium]|nr:OB-fold putative lipoprotein [Limisphaera sp.]MDW8380725.1 hypothetical protein [Verrucomicrobiota bacterium]
MRNRVTPPLALLVAWSILPPTVLKADTNDTVTLPRWRYEELLRKEAELEERRLTEEPVARKASSQPELKRSQDPIRLGTASPARQVAEPTLFLTGSRDSATSAADLARLFEHDPTRTLQQYRGQILRVRGQIAGFDKPLLTSKYCVYLETSRPNMRFRCVVELEATQRGVYVAEAGATLMVVDASGRRRPHLRLGQTIELMGRLRSVNTQLLEMTGCRLVSRS